MNVLKSAAYPYNTINGKDFFVENFVLRFGFNGKERDNETYGEGNAYNFDARICDVRLGGRFFSIDPNAPKYPYYSPYLFAANCPIRLIDVNGKGPGDVMQGFAAAMADYATGGITKFRNWTEVEPENAADFNKGLQIADAYMVALALAEIGGGTGATGAGLVTMQAGIATLVVPGIGEVSFAIAEMSGGTMAIVGSLVAGHGAAMLKTAQDNIEKENGYREIPKPPKGKGQVEPSKRDPKRAATKNERQEMLESQNGKCAQCKQEKKVDEVDAHHVERHADGGKTVKENMKAVCKDCHKELHK